MKSYIYSSTQIIIMVIFALIIGIVYFDLGGKKVPLESINNIITDRCELKLTISVHVNVFSGSTFNVRYNLDDADWLSAGLERFSSCV